MDKNKKDLGVNKMKKPLRYFIEVVGDHYTCTSTLERNEQGFYEFKWESDFQSGVLEYEKIEGYVLEITKEEYDMIQRTVEEEELLDYQLEIKELVIQHHQNKEGNKMNGMKKEFMKFINETNGLETYQIVVQNILEREEKQANGYWESLEKLMEKHNR